MTAEPPNIVSDPDDRRRDYEVGYGRPPVATQFKPGGIGNPKGRPKKQKTVGQMIEDALMTRVTIEENGRRKSLTALEVIIRNLVHAAARRDGRAIRTLFSLKDRYQERTDTTLKVDELDTNDRAIIEEYLQKVSGHEDDLTSPSSDRPATEPAASDTANSVADAPTE